MNIDGVVISSKIEFFLFEFIFFILVKDLEDVVFVIIWLNFLGIYD